MIRRPARCSSCDATSAGRLPVQPFTFAAVARKTKKRRRRRAWKEGRLPACVRKGSVGAESDPDHTRILSQATVTSPRPARHVAQGGDGDRKRLLGDAGDRDERAEREDGPVPCALQLLLLLLLLLPGLPLPSSPRPCLVHS